MAAHVTLQDVRDAHQARDPDLVELFLRLLTEPEPERPPTREGAYTFRQFLQANPDLDDELNRRSFEVTVSLFAEGLRHDDAAVWDALQTYLVSEGLMAEALPTDDLLTAELLVSD